MTREPLPANVCYPGVVFWPLSNLPSCVRSNWLKTSSFHNLIMSGSWRLSPLEIVKYCSVVKFRPVGIFRQSERPIAALRANRSRQDGKFDNMAEFHSRRLDSVFDSPMEGASDFWSVRFECIFDLKHSIAAYLTH